MPIAAIFLHSFHIVVSSVFRERGDCATAPPLETPWRNYKQIQREDFFKRLLCFWDENSTKTELIQSEDVFLKITTFLEKKLRKPGQI